MRYAFSLIWRGAWEPVAGVCSDNAQLNAAVYGLLERPYQTIQRINFNKALWCFMAAYGSVQNEALEAELSENSGASVHQRYFGRHVGA